MAEETPCYIADAVNTLCEIMLEYGDDRAVYEVSALRRALRAQSVILGRRAETAWNNCILPSSTGDIPSDRKVQAGEALNMLADWSSGRRTGPPKQFPYRFELRLDGETKRALDMLQERSEGSAGEIIRRLIRRAAGVSSEE